MCEDTLPRVSVVIPTYNSERFIVQAVQSVLAQTYSSYEVIVVDDGSTDQTKSVVSEFGDHITYVYQENRGPSAARNTGIRVGRGEYICFLDADDVWWPNKLEAQIAFMDQHPSLGLMFSDEEEGDKEKILHHSILTKAKFGPEIVTQVPLRRAFCKLVRENFIPTSTVLVKKVCFEKVGFFDESLKSVEDRDMWLRIAAHTEIGCLPVRVGRKHVHQANVSADSELALRSKIRVWEKNRRLFPKLAPASLWDGRVADAHLKLGYVLLEKKRKSEALRMGILSLIRAVQSVVMGRAPEERFSSYPWRLGCGLVLCALIGRSTVQSVWRASRGLLRAGQA